MLKKFALVAALAVIPATAFAQNPEGAQGGAASGIVGGATAGAVGGAVVGGPVGAVVGGVGGAVVGGVTGGIIGDNTPRFRTYVVEQRVPSYTYAEPVTVGTVLPQRGVVYREVPAEFGERASGYRYTVVNNRAVLVEPQSRRIVQIIE